MPRTRVAVPVLALVAAALAGCTDQGKAVQEAADTFAAGLTAGDVTASAGADAQKAFVIKQGEEGTPVAEVCRKAGISQATYFNWKKKYAGLLPTEMRRLRELEEENGRLKKIVADLSLEKAMLKEVASGNF